MKKILYIIIGLIILTGCQDDFLDTENKEYVSEEQLKLLADFSPEALLAVTDGIVSGSYTYMREYDTWPGGDGRHDDFGQKSIDLGLDLMSNDVVQVRSHWFSNYYSYEGRTEPYSTTHIIWNFYYKLIRQVNDAILFIPQDTDDVDLKATLGRALAIRGFAYFNLVRIYQHEYVDHQSEPGVCIPDIVEFIDQPRSSVQKVYDILLDDLLLAYELIEGYKRPSLNEMDQSVVAGILARVYLEMEDWTNANLYASEAVSEYSVMSSDDYLGGFSNINDKGWMWGADINAESSTVYASFFSHMSNLDPGYAGILGVYKSIDKRLYDLIPATDVRKKVFAGEDDPSELPMYANMKFVDGTFFEGDYLYMRASEMYLIQAEALANLSQDVVAADTLFALVSKRDPSYITSTNTGSDLLQEIYLQRRIELWGEGFAWFDMKRWGVDLDRVYNESNHAAFGSFDFPAGSNKFVFQIPEDEMIINDKLSDSDQNPL
jgi:hypothetical protein